MIKFISLLIYDFCMFDSCVFRTISYHPVLFSECWLICFFITLSIDFTLQSVLYHMHTYFKTDKKWNTQVLFTQVLFTVFHFVPFYVCVCVCVGGEGDTYSLQVHGLKSWFAFCGLFTFVCFFSVLITSVLALLCAVQCIAALCAGNSSICSGCSGPTVWHCGSGCRNGWPRWVQLFSFLRTWEWISRISSPCCAVIVNVILHPLFLWWVIAV